jgi:transcriptional regulator with XRE-family HTH domain
VTRIRLKNRDKPEGLLQAEEDALLAATELVCAAMEEDGVSRQELAQRLDISASEVTQRLGGARNLTLRSLVDMLDALGRELVLASRRKSNSEDDSGRAHNRRAAESPGGDRSRR